MKNINNGWHLLQLIARHLMISTAIAWILGSTPSHALRKPLIHGICTRPFPAIFQLDYALCRASAWLKALQAASARLPGQAEIHFTALRAAPHLLKLAEAGLLYPLDVVTPEKANSRDIRVFLKDNKDAPRHLEQILKDPWPLLIEMCIIWETGETVALLQKSWPPTVEEARQHSAELDKLGNLLNHLWQLQASQPERSALSSSMPSVAIALEKFRNAPVSQADLAEIRDALKLCLEREVKAPDSAALWNIAAAWLIYLRGEIHQQLGQTGLANTDYNTAITRLDRADGLSELKAVIALGRASLHKNLGHIREMCGDLAKACSLGRCEGLATARRGGYCVQDARP